MKNYCLLLGLLIALLLARAGYAQGVGIGTGALPPAAGAALEVKATDKGVLIPRLTASQRAAIGTPPQGLLVYQTDGTAGGGTQTGFWYYAGSPAAWVFLIPGDNLGNHLATQALNLQANALTGTGADLGAAVGVGVRADGGLNLGQNTAGENFLIGYRAGENTSTGYSNVFLGREAGYLTTTGYGNLFVGYQAGRGNNAGSNNICIGSYTGFNIQNSTDNVILGNSAGFVAANYKRNTLLGHVTGTYLSGNGNLLAGYASGSLAYAAQRNVVLGDSAGYNLGAGSLNVLVGYQAGLNNTVSTSHFVGYQAGRANSTGPSNHFAGYQAGMNNSTGGNNHFEGYQAGLNNDTGDYNTAVGYQAGKALYTGGSNTFLGWQAGKLTSSGSNNLLLGTGSGFSNQGGSSNVMLGASTGFFSTGDKNVFVGATAGQGNTSGDNNTALGYGAGPTASTPSLTNATALGYNAQVTQSNSLVLGGTGANAVSVGIGTTAPAATLDVRRGTATNGTAAFSGTTRMSHFSYATAEDTYIRGGKATSNVLLNDNGGNVGVRIATPTSGLQVASSFSVPFRTVVQMAGAYVNVTLTDDDHTVRSGTPSSVTGGPVFSFLLPNPVGHVGRVYVLLNFGNTPANLYANNGSTALGLNLIYDDATSAYLTQIPANSRLTLQSDGSTWLTLAR